MWTKSGIESEGQYAVTYELAGCLRLFLDNDEKHEQQRRIFASQLKSKLLKIDQVPLPELDIIFSILSGGDFLGLQSGTLAKTKDNQLVTIVGFSSDWDHSNQLAAQEQEKLENLGMTMNIRSMEDKAVCLFFDPANKGMQELIKCDLKDLSPVTTLEKQDPETIARFNLLNDIEIIRSFIELLNSPQTSTGNGKVHRNQLCLHILKAISSMINQSEGTYLTTLKNENLLEPFVKYLYQRQSSSSGTLAKELIPVEWIEMKCTQMKKKALENDVALVSEKSSMTGQVINKKQIIISTTDEVSGELFIKNAPLISAINLHELQDGKQYPCVQSRYLIDFISAPTRPNQLLNKTHGIVFCESSELQLLDNKAVNILLTSSVVVTTNDIKPQEFYTRLIELVKRDDEKEEKLRTLQGLLESIVLFIKKPDFDRLLQPTQAAIKPIFKQSSNTMEGLINEMHAWLGLDKDFLLYHLGELKDEPFSVLAMKLVRVLKDREEDLVKNKDKLKQLEQDKKMKEVEILKAKLAELDDKKAKEMQEKLAKIRTAPIDGAAPVSAVERSVGEDIKKAKEIEGSEVAVLDMLKNADKKVQAVIEQILSGKVSVYREDVPSEEKKKKSDDLINKSFYNTITDFNDSSLPYEYDQTLTILSEKYGSRTLVNILQNEELLPTLLPSLLVDKHAQRIFVCFIKKSFIEALIMKISTGQKQQFKTIKKILTNVLTFCLKEEGYRNFVEDLISYDILHQGIETIKLLFKESIKSVLDMKSEEHILTRLNPFFFSFLLRFLLKSAPDHLLTSKTTPRTLIPNMFNIAIHFILLFQDDDRSGIVARMYSLLVMILDHADKNREHYTQSGVIEQLVNCSLLKKMVDYIDYDSDSSQYNNQQKMLLELNIKLEEIFERARKIPGQEGLMSVIENSDGILFVKRGKKILQEKDKFEFLKYYVHQQGLEKESFEMFNQSLEQNHPAFDCKVMAKFSMKEVQKMTLKFRETMKMRDFSFIAVGMNTNDEESMQLFSQEEIKSKDDSEIELFRNEFYLIYPVIKQMVIAFGEGADHRLGSNSTSNQQPKAIATTKELKPKRIFTGVQLSIFVDEDDQIWRAGQIKKLGNTNQEYKLEETIKGKVRLVSIGKQNVTVVTEDNTIFRMGFGKEGHLGINESYHSFTKMEKVEDHDQITEKIVDISSGNYFTLYVTESGKVFCSGNRFLKEISLDCDNKIIPVPLKDGVKVLRVHASMGHNAPLALIKVQLKNGQEQYWSAGKSEQGLLGQGQGVKTSKTFRPMKYDSANIKFIDLSVKFEHAVAMDEQSRLYGWGCNLQKRAGFKEEIFDGVYEPRRITFYEPDNLIPLKISCGFDHTLILFKDATSQQQKLFSIGQNETNYHHLGITQIEATDQTVFFREVTAFRGLEIEEFDAGSRTSHVIIKGDKTLKDRVQEHYIGDQVLKGIVHFYKDSDGKIVWVSETDYQAKKAELPDICFAIKYPITNLDQLPSLPDLTKLAQDILDDSGAANHSSVTCDHAHGPIDSPVRYSCTTRLNGEEQQINISETSFHQVTAFDLNPHIFYRLRRPLKQDATLPLIDPAVFYKQTGDHGIDIEVEPQFDCERNEKLVEATKSAFDELIENVNKFLPELDSDLLREMDSYINKNLSDKEIKDLKAKDDFKIGDMSFKNPKLKKLSENVKRRRIELYLNFNQFFVQLMPYISLNQKSGGASGGDMTKLFNEVKSMILFSMKNKFLKTIINTLPRGEQQTTELKRRKAQNFNDSGQVDHKGESTLFGQIFQTIKAANNFECFRMNSTDDRPWRANFAGEGSIDAGGPFRDSVSNICKELESDVLPLLIQTVNTRNNHGEYRDCYLPNPSSNSPTHLELFKFLGYLLGFGIRSLSPMNLHFPPIFWKQILGEPLTYNDLKGIDQYSWKTLEDLKLDAKKLSNEEFEVIVQHNFTTYLSNKVEVELKRGGAQIQLTKENLDEYIDLVCQARFKECENQIKHIIEGIEYVIPIANLKLFTWDEIDQRACGDKLVDLEKLKKITDYSSVNAEDPQMMQFWKVLEGFTDLERQLYLKFVWGRSRLPYDVEGIRDRHMIDYESYKGDSDFPVAHTCFFQLDLPKYSTEEICRQRLITAITMCGEIDADRDYVEDVED